MLSRASICSALGRRLRVGRRRRNGRRIEPEVVGQAGDASVQLRQPGRVAGRALDQRDPGVERAPPVALLQQRQAPVEARPRVGGIQLEGPAEGVLGGGRDDAAVRHDQRLAKGGVQPGEPSSRVSAWR